MLPQERQEHAVAAADVEDAGARLDHSRDEQMVLPRSRQARRGGQPSDTRRRILVDNPAALYGFAA